jgi:hypothetical protein
MTLGSLQRLLKGRVWCLCRCRRSTRRILLTDSAEHRSPESDRWNGNAVRTSTYMPVLLALPSDRKIRTSATYSVPEVQRTGKIDRSGSPRPECRVSYVVDRQVMRVRRLTQLHIFGSGPSSTGYFLPTESMVLACYACKPLILRVVILLKLRGNFGNKAALFLSVVLRVPEGMSAGPQKTVSGADYMIY